jgi:hypothetical protein
MRGLLFALMASAALVGQADAAKIQWQGPFIITGKIGACDYDPTGEDFSVRFMPEIAGSENGPGGRFSLVGGHHYGYAFKLPSGNFDAQFRAVESVGWGAGFGPTDTRVRFISVAPAITANAPFLLITGQIRNFDGMAGCTVSFRMNVTRELT